VGLEGADDMEEEVAEAKEEAEEKNDGEKEEKVLG
jgi:hypothetical protein